MPARASSLPISSLPIECLMAISERETALNSRLLALPARAANAFFEIRLGDSIAQMKVTVSSNRRTSFSPSKERVYLFVRHRLPPIRIVNHNLSFERAEFGLFGAVRPGTYKIGDGHASSADDDGFAILRGFYQFRKFVLGVGDANPHMFIIAISGGYMRFGVLIPKDARKEAGFQLGKVQAGLEPDDWKPFDEAGAATRGFGSGRQTLFTA